jgi:hypothetical protein
VNSFADTSVNSFADSFMDASMKITHIEELDDLLRSRRKCQKCEKISIMRSCIVMINHAEFGTLPMRQELCWRCAFREN